MRKVVKKLTIYNSKSLGKKKKGCCKIIGAKDVEKKRGEYISCSY